MRQAIALRDNKDGTYTLTYFDQTVGHISRVKRRGVEEPLWRAVQHLNGQIHYVPSKAAARRYLMENFA